MLLQLSHFFLHIILLCPAPPPSSIPPLLHVHRLYISILWLVHFLYYSKPPPVYFVPTNSASYSLYLFPHSPFPLPTEIAPCDVHFSDSVPVLIVYLVIVFVFLFGSFVDSCEFVVILLFVNLIVFFFLD